LERKGEPIALVTTKGFKDVLVIGNQSRPNLFDLSVRKPGMLYETVLEIDERVLLADEYQIDGAAVQAGITGEKVQIDRAPSKFDQATRLTTQTLLPSATICSFYMIEGSGPSPSPCSIHTHTQRTKN
jgi:hypothetical protein